MLGKMRQDAPEPLIEESFDAALGPSRGVMRQSPPAQGSFRHARRSAAPELAPWVDHYWMVYWDLRGLEPRLVETLPHPNVHVVFERPESKVWGVSTTKFSRMLEGKAHCFGIKFTPGGFHPFLGTSVSTITDRSVSIRKIFGGAVEALEAIILASENEDEMMAAANAFLLRRIPSFDEKITRTRQLVQRVLQEREILTVEELAARAEMSPRSLQRLFSQYVGGSPKWVIQRYRLHELLERMHAGERLDWAQLAAELGYFDQAHLINDFKSITGYTPTEYSGRQ